jgi:ATP:ADP antiporter, AAA family
LNSWALRVGQFGRAPPGRSSGSLLRVALPARPSLPHISGRREAHDHTRLQKNSDVQGCPRCRGVGRLTEGHGNLTGFERLLSLVTRVRPGEGRAAFLFFLHGFLLLASYQVVKALREAFILTKFSAETSAYVVALMALVLMVVVPLYGRLRHRLDGAQLLRAVTIFFVATMPLFAALAHYEVQVAIVFFLWVGIYGVMVVAQMWAFAADSFNVKTGQRLFVVIMLGANLGALAGAKLTQFVASSMSTTGLIILAAFLLGATLFLATPERAAVPEGSRSDSAEHSKPMPHLLGGIGLVLRNRYLLLIAVFVVLLNWINSTGEYILRQYVKEHAVANFGTDDAAVSSFIAAFYGNFFFWVTLIGLAIQLLLVSRIYRAVGVRGALLVHPTIVTLGYGLLALAPMLGGFIPIFSLIRRIKMADNGVDYSLMNTTRQALFLPVDRDAKYDGKMAIDTFFWRFGDLIQAVAIYVGLNLLDWSPHHFAVQNLVLSLVWIGVAVVMGRDYGRKVKENVTNTPPEAVEQIPDLHCSPGQLFVHPVPAAAFRDADPGDVLILRACCEDGRPLPRWLRFDVWKQTFTGKAPPDFGGKNLCVAVIASDLDGLKARSTFHVRLAPA